MDFGSTLFAVFGGNVITACFLWSVWEMKKHDINMSWVAYVAFILPLLFLGSFFYTG